MGAQGPVRGDSRPILSGQRPGRRLGRRLPLVWRVALTPSPPQRLGLALAPGEAPPLAPEPAVGRLLHSSSGRLLAVVQEQVHLFHLESQHKAASEKRTTPGRRQRQRQAARRRLLLLLRAVLLGSAPCRFRPPRARQRESPEAAAGTRRTHRPRRCRRRLFQGPSRSLVQLLLRPGLALGLGPALGLALAPLPKLHLRLDRRLLVAAVSVAPLSSGQ